MNVRESAVEGFLRLRVHHLGGLALKLVPVIKGVPDRLVILHGQMYLVETKAPDGVLSDAQRLWHERIGKMGIEVFTLYTREQVVEWLRERMYEIDGSAARDALADKGGRGALKCTCSCTGTCRPARERRRRRARVIAAAQS